MIGPLAADGSARLYEGEYLRWIVEIYAEAGVTVPGFGLFVLFGGAMGLWNWTERKGPPLVWLALMTPTVAIGLLPAAVLRRIAGALTLMAAFVLIGLYLYSRRF